jgi:predicted transcriptional regulator
VTTIRADLDIPASTVAEQVLDTLQHHPTRDRVELIVDLGLTWDALEPTVDDLVSNGYLIVDVVEGDPVYELTDRARSAEPS